MIFLLFIFPFLVKKCSSRQSYEKSIFGHPGVDEVENEWVDGIEILETNLPIPTRKHIKEAHFTSEEIPDNCYPYSNHNLNLSYWNLIKEENKAIHNFYENKINLQQEDLYWHPAAAQNYFTTQEFLDKAARVKIKFTIQPRYTRHVIPAFFPPGELITVEISDGVKDIITLKTNPQCKPFDGENPSNQQRLNNPQLTYQLKNTVNTIGTPYGGSCSVHVTTDDPIDIIFSGVILQPYFYYGMTSDEEWENDLSQRPGPFAYLDTGNLVHLMPANSEVRSSYRMNDCMKYWRSSVQISQTTALDYVGYGNSRFGRIHNPCIVYYDVFVPYGEACSYTTTNHIQAPPYWVTQTVSYAGCSNNPWGISHEINHQHQYDWGKTQSSGEMTNNAINLITYAKTNIASSFRSTGDWPRYSYASHMLNDQDNYGLSRYSTMIHFFGASRFKKFVTADQLDLYYPKNVYGVPGSEMLKASKELNRSMRYHWNFHHTTDEVLNGGSADTLGELEKLNLKPFHPVTTVYAVGLVLDGEDIITARPYRIIPIEQTIDFVSTMVQRADKEKFGDFEYQNAVFEEGRESAWTEKSKGVFTLHPKENISEIEEVRVNYLDKTTNEIHSVICQFTCYYTYSGVAKYTRYGYIPNTENDIFKSYRYIAEHGTEKNIISQIYTSNGLASPDYSNSGINTWITVLEGMLKPPQSGNYVFSASADIQALFYLSEKPLQGNPDLDAEFLTNFQDGTQTDFNLANKSKEMYLDSEKYYYFRHVVYPNRGGDRKGRGWIGFKRNGQGSWITVPSSWMRLLKVNEEEMYKFQFVPDFERIYEMDVYNGIQIIKNPQDKWNVYKHPTGGCYKNANDFQGVYIDDGKITNVLTDSIDTTEFRVRWYPSNSGIAFPHVYEVDMGEMQSFNVLKVKGSVNSYWQMYSYFKAYCAPYNYSATEATYQSDNYSINHEESLIWEGFYDTSVQSFIDFHTTQKGRYLKLVFLNNSRNWKDGNTGRTDISALEVGININNKKIYPITNTRYITFTNRWDEYRGGAYYNGKGYTGYAAGAAPSKEGDTTNEANSIMTIRIPKLKPEFGILGDYYPEMGTAIVKIDGKQVGIIGPNNQVDENDNARKLTKAKRSYKSILFYTNTLDTTKQHTCTVEVIEGQITFAGLLTHQMIVKYDTDDYRYQRILETEFDEEPEQYPWDLPSDEFLHPQATPYPSNTPDPTFTPKETPVATETPEPTNTPAPSYTPPNYADLKMAEATGNYAQSAQYVNQQLVPKTSFLSLDYSGEKSGKPISNAFDLKKDTYWVSSKQNTDTFKNYLTVEFNAPQCLEAILFDPAYSTKWNDPIITRRYDGFPLVLKVYISSNDDEEFYLHAIFTGPPQKTDIWDRILFAFPDPIWCNKIKVEFFEITRDESFDNDFSIAVGNIIFIKTPKDVPTISPVASPEPTPLGYELLDMVEATGDYVQSSTYVKEHMIPTTKFTYEHSGSKDQYPITNAFDLNKDTFWITSKANTDSFKNYLTLTFTSPQLIEAILIDPLYATQENPKTRKYEGFPQFLKVYTSYNDEELKIHSAFRGAPESTNIWDRVKFSFSSPIWCSKIKVEFDEVTLNENHGNDYNVAVGNIIFVSPQSLIPTPSPALTPEPTITPEQTNPPTETPQATVIALNYDNLTTIEALGKYAQSSSYVDEYKVPMTSISYEASSEHEDQPLSNVFDGNKNTYWIPSKPKTETFKNYIIVNFSVHTNIEAILLDPTFTTNYTDEPSTRRYDGFPFIMKVYISFRNEDYRLHSVFNGGPQSTDFWDRAEFVFLHPAWCDSVKLEFYEVTPNGGYGNEYLPSCSEITFISTTVIPPPTQTPLSYEELIMIEATGDYAQSSLYVNEHSVPFDSFTYEHSGAKDQYPITNAFDGDKDTFWVTSKDNTESFKNYLTVSFENTKSLEAVLFDSAYKNNGDQMTRTYHGFPKVFKIYTSLNDDEFKLNSIFRGPPEPTDFWDRIKLEFSTPITCNKIKVEFDQVTNNEMYGNDHSVAVGNIFFISTFSNIQTPISTINPTEEEKPTEIIIEDVNLSDKRYTKIVDNLKVIFVHLKSSNFVGIKYTGNGGAIYIVNAGFLCNKLQFIDCSSTEAGGAIYLNYFYNFQNSYELDDLTFKQCSAQFGGAVYFYSSSKKNSVMIKNCLFEKNVALRKEVDTDNNFGGSAIFMTAKTGVIKDSKLNENEGDSVIKIINNFIHSDQDSNHLSILDQNKFVFSDCKFENSKNSRRCIYYLLGNGDSEFEVEDCTFLGNLNDGEHYIDGKVIDGNGQKLVVKECKFAVDSDKALNLVSNLIKVDLDDQKFNYHEDEDDDDSSKGDNKSSDTWKLIVMIVVPVVVVVIIIVVAVLLIRRKKKKNNDIDVDSVLTETEMTAQTCEIPENDSELNAPLI